MHEVISCKAVFPGKEIIFHEKNDGLFLDHPIGVVGIRTKSHLVKTIP